MTERLTIRRPDDWHVHLRDDAMLEAVVDQTARQFARAIVMPNLVPPVTTKALGSAYRDRIMAAVSPEHDFTPLMTAYLTDTIDPAELVSGHREGIFTAAKLYPAGATTNSDAGVTNIANIYPVLEAMEKAGMPLLVHGEVTSDDIDIFDREAVFIDRVMIPTVKRFEGLKVVFEHITTKDAADFVEAGSERIAATITPHHLHFSRNAIFKGGINPHRYCLPIAKREEHRLALRKAATSGSAKFFLGTDTAPHVRSAKESACGCAGIFNAPYALESYAMVFEEEDALGHFEAFASLNGPAFYGLPVNEDSVTLVRGETEVPETLGTGETLTVPFHAGETIPWRFEGRS
ncbi:dihydroorotase [Parvularcula sp. ZS-1/3]|uniref:Dihydroorotase n=1 Tax=Parvularcula mediterranea TaxID=2732508 RepID=A0A7Y3RJU9_9PROT|nr:dihydroorotase [Parvularcula mediterranea]NNU15419.1 dihydroorotase [Parvularcula mediterranea]